MNVANCTAAARPQLFWLDAIRAAAAALVLLSHARTLLLRDAADQMDLSLVSRAFFALSGLGHQAVIVFFVLSGYLVTGRMLRMQAAGTWALSGFALDRLVRLWIVLVPCLLLGAGLDGLGLALRPAAEAGAPYGVLPVANSLTIPTLTMAAFAGNVLFLQTALVPVFGSNGALWSLANEAWYYVAAALLFTAWLRRDRLGTRLPYLVVVAGLALLLPTSFVRLAPIWAIGSLIALRPGLWQRLRPERVWVVALGLFFAVLTLARLRWSPGTASMDIALGAATAMVVACVSRLEQAPSGPVARLVGVGSRMSYSLYLSHCPVLALFASLAVGSTGRLLAGWKAYGLLAAALAAAVVVAAVVWWLFEHHTDRCRTWCRALVGPRRMQPLRHAEPVQVPS